MTSTDKCGSCSRPAISGQKYCVVCAGAHRKNIDRQRVQRAELGLCIECGRPRDGATVRCLKCQKRSNAWSRAYQATKRLKKLEEQEVMKQRNDQARSALQSADLRVSDYIMGKRRGEGVTAQESNEMKAFHAAVWLLLDVVPADTLTRFISELQEGE